MFIVFLDSTLCVHHKVCSSKVNRYKKEIENGDLFPPIEVVEKDGVFLVLDGAHRTQAHKELNLPILAMVYDWEDCPKKFLIGRRIVLTSSNVEIS